MTSALSRRASPSANETGYVFSDGLQPATANAKPTSALAIPMRIDPPNENVEPTDQACGARPSKRATAQRLIHRPAPSLRRLPLSYAKSPLGAANSTHGATMRSLVATRGLPQIDSGSWAKGVSDGRRGLVWWPDVGTEPLSYSSGYAEGEAARAAAGEPPLDRRPIAGALPRLPLTRVGIWTD